jgi:hypothetical protein
MSGNFQLDFNFTLWLRCGVSMWVLSDESQSEAILRLPMLPMATKPT